MPPNLSVWRFLTIEKSSCQVYKSCALSQGEMVQTLGRCALPQPENQMLGPLSPYLLPESGKKVGIASFNCCSRARFEGKMWIRFAEYENWKSFTALGPMVLLNLAAMIRPGWFHDSSITPSELLPQPKPLEGGPICQESFVYLSINVRVFVRLMSPRAFSSRQGVGTFCDAVQFMNGQEVDV